MKYLHLHLKEKDTLSFRVKKQKNWIFLVSIFFSGPKPKRRKKNNGKKNKKRGTRLPYTLNYNPLLIRDCS
jgi:hypothetical protein